MARHFVLLSQLDLDDLLHNVEHLRLRLRNMTGQDTVHNNDNMHFTFGNATLAGGRTYTPHSRPPSNGFPSPPGRTAPRRYADTPLSFPARENNGRYFESMRHSFEVDDVYARSPPGSPFHAGVYSSINQFDDPRIRRRPSGFKAKGHAHGVPNVTRAAPSIVRVPRREWKPREKRPRRNREGEAAAVAVAVAGEEDVYDGGAGLREETVVIRVTEGAGRELDEERE